MRLVYASIAGMCFLFSGCFGKAVFDKVVFTSEPNLETLKVSLVFSPNIATDLGGSFGIKNWGSLELDPTTKTSPFNIGFRLNLNILNDQDYVHEETTRNLPSGDPIPGIENRALAMVRLKNEVSKNFDIILYLDLYAKEWIGMAVLLNYVDHSNFPSDLTLTQNFLENSDGHPLVTAAVFGQTIDKDGKKHDQAGFAFFANARELIKRKSGNFELEAIP